MPQKQKLNPPPVIIIVLAMSLLFLATLSLQAAQYPVISLVTDRQMGPAARHGIGKVRLALEARGITVEQATSLDTARGGVMIVLGLSGAGGSAAKLHESLGIPRPTEAESLVIRHAKRSGKKVLLVSGADDRGLMYALLDVADRIGWAKDAGNLLSDVRDAEERPAVTERALTKFVMNKSEFERYCFNEQYWAQYLDMLAANRFNTFHLLFGYFTQGYFEPMFPFMFDVDGFEGVRVVGITKGKQLRNLAMLKRIIDMTHERGLDFTLGLWTHIHRASKPTEGVPFGLTDDNLIAYTETAMAKFLCLVPDIDAIQFRVHTEAALNLPQQAEFWRRVFTAIKKSGPDIRVDMRAKGFTDDMIDAVLPTGVEMRMTTKYWGEQMGPPYHPTHIKIKNQLKRRHTYADLLRYPRRYKMHWRLWNHGTTRMLLWADPEYVRRFAESSLLWDGDGYEVQEPLAMKMSRHRDDDTFDLLKPAHQYYDWEYERYWHFYQVFGRLGYNPKTPPDVWKREFVKRFGAEAAPYVEQALHLASGVLPRIVAYDLPNLSADITWAEKMRWHDLPTYINNGPMDTAQFVGIEEAARLRIAGTESPRIWPVQTRQWFDNTADTIQELLAEADGRIGGNRNKEFESTAVDLNILAALARYHARRSEAGVSYAGYVYTKDLHSLDEAIRHERRAIAAWEKIVQAADDVYNEYLAFGRRPNLAGHWSGELVELKKGLAKLQETRRAFSPKHESVVAKFDFGDIAAAEGYEPVGRRTGYSDIRGGYGWSHAYTDPAPKGPEDKALKNCDADFMHGPPPTKYAYSGFMADMPSGHYELTLTMQDSSDEPKDYGPMWIVANGMDSTGQFTVAAGRRVEKKIETTVTDGRLTVAFNSASDSRWLVNSMVVRRIEPAIAHFAIRRASPGEALSIWATVTGPDEIRSVRLCRGSARGGYSFITMKRTDPMVYRGEIPASAVTEGLEYYIEAVDEAGRHATFPAGAGVERIQVTVTKDNQPPIVRHKPVKKWEMGKPLSLVAKVTDPSGVKWVRLRYRGVNQHQDFRTLPMLRSAGKNEYRAEIPAEHIRSEWDLMYLIEVMDNQGNGRIYPDIEKETPYVVVELQRD